MAPFSEVLINQLNDLEMSFKDLAHRIPEARELLENMGRPVPQELLRELTNSAEQFEELKREVLKLSVSVGGLPPTPELGSIRDLRSFMETVSEVIEKQSAYRSLQQAACGALEKVLTITHVDGVEFGPLLQGQEKARELRGSVAATAWPDVHPEAEALAGGQHTFSALLKLVGSHDELEDEEWGRLQDLVNQSLGKPLGLAASRGKLILSTSAAPMPQAPDSGPQPASEAGPKVVEFSGGPAPEPVGQPVPLGAAPNGQLPHSPAPEPPGLATPALTFDGTLDDIGYMLVLDRIDSKGMAKILSSKIIAASHAAAGGDKKTAEDFLKAFISEVNTQTGEHISGAAPQLLLTDANILLGQLQ